MTSINFLATISLERLLFYRVLGFKDCRLKDREGAYYQLSKAVFDEVVSPITNDFKNVTNVMKMMNVTNPLSNKIEIANKSSQSSQSSHSSQNNINNINICDEHVMNSDEYINKEINKCDECDENDECDESPEQQGSIKDALDTSKEPEEKLIKKHITKERKWRKSLRH